MILKNLYRLLNIHRGEGRASLFFSLFAFCWALGSSCGATLAEGLFLETIGADYLPLSYIAVGLLMCALSATLIKTINTCSSEAIFGFFFIIAGAFYIFSIFILPDAIYHDRVFVFLYKVFCDTIFMAFTLCFWNYVEQFYDMQDAKRVYCFFNSAILLGTASGGALISEGIEFIGVKGLFILILISFCACTLLFLKGRKTFTPLPSEEAEEEPASSTLIACKRFLKGIIRSPFSLAFASSFLISQILLILTTYGYMDAFELHFESHAYSEGSLTAFLGSCTFWVALANMVFGLFFYSRFIRFAGVNNIILVTPIILTGLYFSWSVSTLFIFAIVGLFTVEGLWFSIDENTCNLIVNAVPPKIRRQVRVAIDSFFEPIGMTLCGLMLYLMQQMDVLHLSAALGLGLSIVFVALTLFIRKSYKAAVIHNLSANSIDFKKSTKEWLHKLSPKDRQNAYFHFLCLLRTSDDDAQLFAFKALLDFEDPRLLPHIVNHLDRYRIRVRLKAMEALEESIFSSHRKVIETMLSWLKSQSHPELIKTAYRYLSRQGALPNSLAATALLSSSLTIQSAGILAYILSGNVPYYAKQALEKLLSSQQLDELQKGIEILGFLEDDSSFSLLVDYLSHPVSFIQLKAAQSLQRRASVNTKDFSRPLIEYLPQLQASSTRFRVIEAIIKCRNENDIGALICSRKFLLPKELRLIEDYIQSLGDTCTDSLLTILKDTAQAHTFRIRAGKALSLINFPLLQESIKDFLHDEVKRAYFLHQQAELTKDMTLAPFHLADILASRYHSLVDFILQIIGVAGKIPNTELLSRCIRSNNQKIHSNALETIEKISERSLFNKLLPLIDDHPPEDIDSIYRNLHIPTLSFDELMELFSSSEFEVDRLIASEIHHYSKEKTSSPNYNLLPC